MKMRDYLIELNKDKEEQKQLIRKLSLLGEPLENYLLTCFFENSDTWDLLYFNEDLGTWSVSDHNEFSEEEYESIFWGYYNISIEKFKEQFLTRKKVGGI